MFDDDTSATIKITFDDISPEYKSFMYTIQALCISVTAYVTLTTIKAFSKFIKNNTNNNTNNYNRV